MFQGGDNAFYWGLKTASNTNYYTDYPNTGVVRTFNWTVTNSTIAPDGVSVPGLLVNGQFPGPMIEANWGDSTVWSILKIFVLFIDNILAIQVNVQNDLDEGTAFHWHGFLQKDSQPYDGVPGVSLCPIPPGGSFTYTFQAQLYGTSWWHSHYSSQYASGLSGPIVIYGPINVPYDIDLGPVLATDWYHAYYMDTLEALFQPVPYSIFPHSQNILIQGKNNFDCSNTSLPCIPDAGIAVFKLTAGKSHRMRLISTSAEATLKISLDDHILEVIANDFVPIEPYNTTVVTLGVGQRSDVIIHANQAANSSYWLRVVAPSGCANNNGANHAQAAFYYDDADLSQSPSSTPQPDYNNTYCGNDPLASTIPSYAIASGDAATTDTVILSGGSNGTHNKWFMNGIAAMVDYNDPILLEAKTGNATYSPTLNVHDYGSNSSVRVLVVNNGSVVHPMHLHGHDMFVLAEGLGTVWDGVVVRPMNPQRRDVQIVRANGYVVLQWNLDNPGTWPFVSFLLPFPILVSLSLSILPLPVF